MGLGQLPLVGTKSQVWPKNSDGSPKYFENVKAQCGEERLMGRRARGVNSCYVRSSYPTSAENTLAFYLNFAEYSTFYPNFGEYITFYPKFLLEMCRMVLHSCNDVSQIALIPLWSCLTL